MRNNSQLLPRDGTSPHPAAHFPISLEMTDRGPAETACSRSLGIWSTEATRECVVLPGLGHSASEAQPGTDERADMLDHLPMVRFIARRIHERLPQHVEMEDLVSAGVLGLIDAFQKFDPAKKVQFRSYAQFRVRGAILDSLRMLDWGPRELRRKGRAVEDAIRILTQKLQRSPSDLEVAAELELDLPAYQQLLGELRGLEIGTLHLEHAEDSGEEELAYVPALAEDDPLIRCLKSEMQARLASAIQALPERERTVLTLYYHEEMTMREIGLALAVVESRISQIHSSAVLRLRAALRGMPDRKRGACTPKQRPTTPAKSMSRN